MTQLERLLTALTDAGVAKYDWFPMIRGRLVAINDKAVNPDNFMDERAKRLVDREFNLSTSVTRPAHNELVGGKWVDNEAGAFTIHLTEKASRATPFSYVVFDTPAP